jgi:hypothetical protein
MKSAGMTLLSLVRLVVVSGGIAACGHNGKMVVDTPIAPYKAPDISDITGIDDDDSSNGSASAGASAGSATPGK